MKSVKIIFLSLLITSLYSPLGQAEVNDSKLLEDSINDMYVVAGSGVGGAIIGLSTLSFVSEPGDHLKNILVGAALGVIGGVAFVGYSTANKGRDMYYDGAYNLELEKEFSSTDRVAWHGRQSNQNVKKDSRELPFFVWGSTF